MDLQESPATIQGKEDDNVHTFQVPSDIHLKVQMYHIRDTKAFFIVGLSPWYRSAEDMIRREDDNVSISSSLIGKCSIASLLASSLPGTLASVSLSGSKDTCQDFSEGASYTTIGFRQSCRVPGQHNIGLIYRIHSE